MKVYRLDWGFRGFKVSMGFKTIVAFFMILIFPMVGTYFGISSYTKNYLKKEYVSRMGTEMKSVYEIFEHSLNYFGDISNFVTSNKRFAEMVKSQDSKGLLEVLSLISEKTGGVNTVFVSDKAGNLVTFAKRDEFINIYLKEAINAAFVKWSEIKGYTTLPNHKIFGENVPAETASLSDSNYMVRYQIIPFEAAGKKYLLGGIILLNNYRELMDKIYTSFTYNTALFSAINLSDRIIATNSSQKNIWFVNLRMPPELLDEIKTKSLTSGIYKIDSSDAAVASIPLKDHNEKVVGGLTIASNLNFINFVIKQFRAIILWIIIISSLIVMVIGGVVYHDTKLPISYLTSAMQDVSKNNLDVKLEFKTSDDFEDIGKYFNIMLDNLKETTTKINQYNQLNSLITSTLDIEKVLSLTLEKIIEYSSSQVGVIYLYDEQMGQLNPYVSKNISFEALKEVSIDEGLLAQVATSKTYFCINEINPDNLIINAGVLSITPSEIAAFPIAIKDTLLGVMVIGSIRSHKKEELDVINGLLVQVAIVLDNCITHSKISELSIKDELTGIYNRRYLLDMLESEIKRYKRYKTPFGVAIFDIDNFKRVNDTYGHPIGDTVLREFSSVINSNKRESDIFGRFGGEEFLIILPNTEKKDLNVVLEKFRMSVELELVKKTGFVVTTSIGATIIQDVADITLDDIILTIDKKLYEAKSLGKNMVLV